MQQMQFRTVIPIKASRHPIDYQSSLFLAGSCFAENIAKKFEYFQFPQSVNPIGILFNPRSLARLFAYMEGRELLSEQQLVLRNGIWNHYDAHSVMAAEDRQQLMDNLDQRLAAGRERLVSASHVFITLGTAWVYRHRESDRIVANCHKVPQEAFEKVLLSVEQVQLHIREMVNSIRKMNPGCHIVFTVSPVRHIKDGVEENNRSKAHLFAALHAERDRDGSIGYFPAYELLMDELRDYRFYADDMLHPSEAAISYIWSRFSETWFSEHTRSVMKHVDGIQKSLQHRPFNITSDSYQQFRASVLQKISLIRPQLPAGAFSDIG